MRGGNNSQGYTIVEAMIFLAISGAMFLLAATFINGKQAKVEFKQGINAMNVQVQQTINDVSNGYYPATTSLGCTSGSGPVAPTFSGTNPGQGANQGCVFLGKFIQFGGSTDPDGEYNTYTVAARQYKATIADGTLTSSFAEAFPVATTNLKESKKLPFGLRVTKITSSGTDITGVGFFNSFSSYNGASGNLESGAQNVAVIPLPVAGAGRNQSEADMVNQIATLKSTGDSSVLVNPDILICFSGGSGQFGTLSIGGSNGQRLATSLQISDSLPAGC